MGKMKWEVGGGVGEIPNAIQMNDFDWMQLAYNKHRWRWMCTRFISMDVSIHPSMHPGIHPSMEEAQ